MPAIVHPIAGAHMDAELAHAINGFNIAKVTHLCLPQAYPDAGLRYFIAQGVRLLFSMDNFGSVPLRGD